MFGSRRRHAPAQLPSASTVDPDAATAAASAFKRRASSASLSAAAAAAALKARPITPTNVAQVQTKRTMRRSSSVASASSAASAPETGRRPAPLQRRGSSGSLTERTFRSPSPHRPGSAGRSSIQADDMPPVPSIPKDVHSRGARGDQQPAGPKSLGISSPPFKVASQKMGEEGSGSWFGAAKVGDASNVRTSDAALQERPSSRGSSINFSYPARVRIGSPPPASPTLAKEETRPTKQSSTRSPRSASVSSDMSLVYDPNSRRMVPRAELLEAEYRVTEAAEKPKPRKKKQTPTRAGSHLAQGTMGRTHGSLIDSGVPNEATKAAAASLRSHRAEERHPAFYEEQQPQPEQAATEPVSASPRQELRVSAESQPTQPKAQIPVSPSSNAPEVYTSSSSSTLPTARQPVLGRKVSTVREETEHEEEGFDSQASYPQSAAAALDAVPVRQTIYEQELSGLPSHDAQPAEVMAAEPVAFTPSIPVELPAAPTPPPAEPPAFLVERRAASMEPRETESLRRERSHSNSPARIAHFGPVNDNLTVRHSPPPRSVSPRKSALKQQSPSRGASPTGDSPEAQPEGAPVQRRKSVRVSFDDENTVVLGRAASPDHTDSPVVPSPQTSKRIPWLSNIGRNKKKDLIPLDDDEIMKPRPALPSFGSVREKKQVPKEQDERPLVTPLDSAHSPPGPSSPVVKASIPSVIEAEVLGQSSDHALGSLLNDSASRNEANISKFREPLPPVVTSIEGSGYVSDSPSSSDNESELIADTPRSEPAVLSQASTLVSEVEQDTPASDTLTSPDNDAQQVASEVKDFAPDASDSPIKEAGPTIPEISITQPSPAIPHETEQASYLDVPGSFPETDSDRDDASKGAISESTAAQPATESTPIRQVTFEPVIRKEDTKSTAQTPSTVLATQPAIADDTDDTDSSEVFSDAYEDLSEIEGDGFLSLDAVVDSPLVTPAPHSIFARAAEAQKQAAEAAKTTQEQGPPSTQPPLSEDDWEKAKTYWRSLTQDKRAQLEREAREEAGAEADLEEQVHEDRKPMRKKSVEKRAAERKALQLQKAIEQEKSANADRVYMIKPGTKVEADPFAPTSKTTKKPREQQAQPAQRKAEAVPRIRKSMRGGDAEDISSKTEEGVPRLRKSMRTDGPASSKRPVSLDVTGSAPQAPKGHTRAVSDTASSQASARAASQGVTSIMPPSLRRRGSDSSASSFKRSRGSIGEGFGFRKTMRPQSPASQVESGKAASSRFSLRSLSPTGSAFRRAPAANTSPASMGGGMRSTLRGASENKGKGSRSAFGRGKAAGKKTSRFDDSSDEDVVPNFRSRFDDSSDEDVAPTPLPPLSVPKSKRASTAARVPSSPTVVEEDEQSSDLPDSDDEKTQRGARATNGAKSSLGTGTLRRSRSGRGQLGSRQSAPLTNGDTKARRTSILSVLRRKKRDGRDKISRTEPTESAARRDTNLERTSEELKSLRSGSQRSRQTGSPKLQKRMASFPGPVRRESWPLPDGQDEGDEEKAEERPVTPEAALAEDGTSPQKQSSLRPAFLHRRTMSTQGTIDTEGVGSKKKKKFGALRRIFKLDD
ncbi:hypothetical protein NKR23_g1984 [Pleurostoma richardsiae]|uniref:Uncharacterized protein n=1 Tax=Pleurostoma richardsiae TaxID=41990 RepID=A0AA38RN72_9PEZI|nr:hypothetical protein NKR23_g1984 [Pleurostoma richardsiae]